jgi:hypothetical protein
MASFVLINKDNVVIQSVSVNNIYLLDENGIEIEQKGIDYLINFQKIKELYPETVLIKQCSYNGKFRGSYAGIGFTYDAVNDVFIVPINEEEININDVKI